MKQFIRNLQITPEKVAPHWARPFFTIWTGQTLILLGSKWVAGFFLPTPLDIEAEGSRRPASCELSSREM